MQKIVLILLIVAIAITAVSKIPQYNPSENARNDEDKRQEIPLNKKNHYPLQTFRNYTYGYEISYPDHAKVFAGYSRNYDSTSNGGNMRFDSIGPTGKDPNIIISDSALEYFDGSEPFVLTISALDEFVEEDNFEVWLDNSASDNPNYLSNFDSYGYEKLNGKMVFRARSEQSNLGSYGSRVLFNTNNATMLVQYPGEMVLPSLIDFPAIVGSLKFTE
jgi:hypothetical protein